MNNNILKKQIKLINKYNKKSRVLENKKIPITGRSLQFYKNHIFPDFSSKLKLVNYVKKLNYLDLGCGINHILEESLLNKVKNSKYKSIGMDIHKFKVNKYYKKGSIYNTKFKKNTFDLITVNNLLYLWIDKPNDILKCFKEFKKILKPDGQVRIFPIFFYNYYMNNQKVKDYIEKFFKIKKLKSKINTEGYIYLSNDKVKKSDKDDGIYEYEINKKLKSNIMIFIKI